MTQDAVAERELGPQMDRQTYFNLLSDTDRFNVQAITGTFKQILEEEGRRVVLKAVGGQLSKPHPRKDLDFNVCLLPEASDQKNGDPPYNQYEKALVNFRILRDIIQRTIDRLSGFKIGKIIEPAIEEEYTNPAVLKTGGSITIVPKEPREGTLIEIFREAENTESVKKGPYVVLINTRKT